MANYYVDASAGLDSNPGTQAEPFKTLDKINNTVLAPGDTVYFHRGQEWEWSLMPGQSGNAGSPIIFRDYGEGDNAPLVNGTATASYSVGAIHAASKNHLTFKNLRITDAAFLAVFADGCSNLVFEDCEFLEGGVADFGCIYINGGGGHALRRCEISSTIASGLMANAATITLEDVSVLAFKINYGFNFQGACNITASGCLATGGVRTGTCWPTGWLCADTTTATLTDCQAIDNPEDGFDASDSAVVSLTRCYASGNGDTVGAASGEGFTSHQAAQMTLVNCVAERNGKSGFGSISTGAAVLDACYLKDNHKSGVTADSRGILLLGATPLTVRNSTIEGHDFFIEGDATAVAGATLTLSGNRYLRSWSKTPFKWPTAMSLSGWQALGFDAGARYEPRYLEAVPVALRQIAI